MDWLEDNMGIIIIVGLVFFIGGGSCGVCCIEDVGGSDGQHIGVVTSVERLKNFTWDSTIAHIKSDAESTQEEAYCVETLEVEKQLIDAAKNKKRIIAYYHNDLFMMRWECNGGESIIWKVEVTSEE